MTRRRWIADEWKDRTASVRGEQAAHLIRVLRAQTGTECDMVAGDRVWHAVISGVSGDAVQFTLLSEVKAEPALPVTLLVSVFKFDRMEWMIEKATELGAERIIPITARRSEKHLVQAAPARVERWRRIAREAAKQSRRSDVPVVEEVMALKSAAQEKLAQPGLRLLLAEQERSTTLYAAMRSAVQRSESEIPGVRLAVGPEGGWTAEEEALFTSEGWQAVSLGPRILRAETAGITAVAVVAAMLA
ncbi:MAG TPA: 16S rRNA (uracil(1498)-N(3))-methyltransferase [Acidobacteriaceae bacterium]|nr:16S rRNA (uracil(1498)-N(3))-methyltransferase [Acidobacteriaceae bacterium]